jgi:hypothetical protein
MLQCEARFVVTLPEQRRREYLDTIERRRGPDGLSRLLQAVRKLPAPRR